MKIAVMTLGCRTNQAESSLLYEKLIASGHQTVGSAADAEIIVINTCSVTASAERQSRYLVAKALKTGAKVIVTGCYAELNRDAIAGKSANIVVVNNNSKDDINSLIPGVLHGNQSANSAAHRHRPVVKIQDGCNDSCSYCIIPLARGRSKSILPETVLKNVLKYEALGFQEVVLSGIHLGHYGYDLDASVNLDKLLLLLLKNCGISRIRLSSIEIHEVTDLMLELMACGRICNHLHVPLQGATDNILIKMNRNYSIDSYRAKISRISELSNNICIGTDLMVGFPGEKASDFESALENITSMPFSYLHIFPFSGRPGTAAYNMQDQVPVEVKKERVARLIELGVRVRAAFIERNVGLSHEIIVESSKGGKITGTTANYVKVSLDDDVQADAGMLIRIRITGHNGSSAFGIPL
jgi:threonylcarbamoyladenosine tRNA methylthiotransferase MtaB